MSNRRIRRRPPPLPSERETTAVEEMPGGATDAQPSPTERRGNGHDDGQFVQAEPAGQEAFEDTPPAVPPEPAADDEPLVFGSQEPPDLSSEDDALVFGGEGHPDDSSATQVVAVPQAPDLPPAGGEEKTEIMPIGDIKPPEPEPALPMLVVELPDGTSSDVEIASDTFVIGRAPECDAVIPDRLVSRRHAVIERRGNAWYVVDQNSGNGTRLNSEQIQEAELVHGDVIEVGTARLVFQLPSAGEMPAGQAVERTMVAPAKGSTAVIEEPRPLDRFMQNKLLLAFAAVAVLLLIAGIVKVVLTPSGPTPEEIAARKRLEEQRRREAERQQALADFEAVKKLVQQEKWAEAKPIIERISAVLPDDRLVQQYAATIQTEASASKMMTDAKARLAVEDFQGAVALLAKIPKDSMQFEEAESLKKQIAQRRIDTLLQKARLLAEEDKLDEALTVLDELLEAAPENPDGLALKQQLLEKKQRKELASRTPRRKKKPKPKPKPEPKRRGRLAGASLQAYLKGDLNRALSMSSASGLSPQTVSDMKKLKQLFERGKQLARNPGMAPTALKFLKKAYELDGKLSGGRGKLRDQLNKLLAKVYFIIGTDAQNRNKYEKAFKSYNAALKHRPDLNQARNRLQDLEKQARRIYEQAYVFKSTDPERSTRLCKTVMKMVTPSAYAYRRCKKLLRSMSPHGGGEEEEDF